MLRDFRYVWSQIFFLYYVSFISLKVMHYVVDSYCVKTELCLANSLVNAIPPHVRYLNIMPGIVQEI